MRFLEYKTYWEKAAKSNRKIGHLSAPKYIAFAVKDIEEIMTEMKLGMTGMVMIMENPEIKPYDGLSDNIRKYISGGVLIIKEYKKGDFADRDKVSEECEIVCEQMMAKLKNDYMCYKHNRSHPHKIEGIDMGSMAMNKASGLFGGFWTGYRLSFTLNQRFENNLQLNADDWYDDTPFEL